MDPITAAIVSAVVAGVLKVGEQAVKDAYDGLKALIHRKFGDNSEIAEAVQKVESHPTSQPRQMVLAETVADTKAGDDPELVTAAEQLLTKIGALPSGSSVVQQVTESSYTAQAAFDSNATVNSTSPSRDD